MDNDALKCIYCSKNLLKPAKMIRIEKILEEVSDFLFDIEHVSGKDMFVSDFFCHFSSDNQDEKPIPYLTDISCLDNASYMSYLEQPLRRHYSASPSLCLFNEGDIV